jgi:FAD:protein FMN transferase
MPADRVEFRAMGVRAVVEIIGGPAGLAHAARRRLDDLETRWSRFRPTSEIARLAPGAPTLVSEDTYVLLEHAVAGWQLTQGRYDPTVLPAVRAAGYDRSFDELQAIPPSEPPADAGVATGEPAPGCGDIVLDPVVRSVTLPAGVAIDPGGIGKGLASDVVAAEMLASGAEGVLVNLGGDVRVAGDPPDSGSWIVAVEHPIDPSSEIARYALQDGAVATSSRRWRRFVGPDGPAHHIVDPATGRPAVGDVDAATAVAGQGWAAEVFATAAFLAGAQDGPRLLADAGLDGLVVTSDGVVHPASPTVASRGVA